MRREAPSDDQRGLDWPEVLGALQSLVGRRCQVRIHAERSVHLLAVVSGALEQCLELGGGVWSPLLLQFGEQVLVLQPTAFRQGALLASLPCACGAPAHLLELRVEGMRIEIEADPVLALS